MPPINAFMILLLFYEFEISSAQRLPCPTRTTQVSSTEKLRRLRTEMSKRTTTRQAVDAYMITTFDEHQSEYPPEREKGLEYLSGFSGQIAQAAVTKTKAAIWVDDQDYFMADSQLDCNWTIFRLENDQNPKPIDWLRKEIHIGVRVGADPKSTPEYLWDEWKVGLESHHVALETISLVDDIWYDRPTYNGKQAFFIEGGESRESKLEKLRANLTSTDCGAMIVTALDEIAWLLNVRGNEGPFIPFVRSYLIVLARNDAMWYLPADQKTEPIHKELDKRNISRIRTLPYDSFWKDLRFTAQNWGNILVPSRSEISPGASHAVSTAIAPSRRVLRPSPVIHLKAQKNSIEIEGMRSASLLDSTAFVDFLFTLEENMANGTVTEYMASQILEGSRKEVVTYQLAAAPTKVGFGRNGQIRNYVPNANSSADINASSTLVVRTATHCISGTAALARTLHYGVPSLSEIQMYTKTLASLIDFSRQVFPSDIRTAELDVVGRMTLWRSGLDYAHSTGHGIGTFSAFREFPVNIHRKSYNQSQFVEKGNFITAGPSLSKPGVFGIELENVLEVVSNDSGYLSFHEATLVPFETRLIEPKDLTVDQVKYINNYHYRVMQTVGVELKRQRKMNAFYWLMEKTQAIPPYCNSARDVLANVMAILAMFAVRYVL